MPDTPRIATCLWFGGNAEEAAAFYVSLLPGSRVTNVFRAGPGGPAILVEFVLGGTPFQALNGAPQSPPQFPPSEFASISVLTADQAETDRLWAALTADGGSESQCAWLKDRFGVSWQIVPEPMTRMLQSDDLPAAARAMQAMFGMRKIDIAAMERAYRG